LLSPEVKGKPDKAKNWSPQRRKGREGKAKEKLSQGQNRNQWGPWHTIRV
jgi:hypothetical protein